MRRRFAVLLASLGLIVSAPAVLPAEQGRRAACPNPGERDRLQDVTPEGDLILERAGAVRLAGVRLSEEAARRDEALAWLKARTGLAVAAAPLGPHDRWGRVPARLVVVAETGGDGAADLAQAPDLAQALVAAGLALVATDAAGEGCRRALLAQEADARQRGLGLWAGDRYKPVAVADLARLRERIGRFTLVEGQVRSIGERPQRTYLNFSNEWASDFTITIPKRIWTEMAGHGLGAARLKGRRVRARGILEDRQGPALTVTAADEIEVLDEGREP